MTWIDKLEIGLKEDAPYRKDNLPESQVRGPQIPAGPGRSPEIPLARDDRNTEVVAEVDETAESSATDEGMPEPKPAEGADGAHGVKKSK